MEPGRPAIAISLGDPCGIGPEVVLRALLDPEVCGALRPIVHGDRGLWRRAEVGVGQRLDLEGVGGALVPITDLGPNAAPLGGASEGSDRAQRAYLEQATEAVLRGRCLALCTAPITKVAIARAGFRFPGQTEYLQAVASGADGAGVTMMLAGPRLKVSVVTTHLALADVSAALCVEGIEGTILRTHRGLERWFGELSPRIAVCGLNPHAGEQGRFGREEIDLIAPAVARARAAGLDVVGPLSADAALAQAARGAFSGVVAMYHDQGLVAAKAVDQERSVNLTLGLPFVRSSPDHGSALDIAGAFEASPVSMREALLLAARLAPLARAGEETRSP